MLEPWSLQQFLERLFNTMPLEEEPAHTTPRCGGREPLQEPHCLFPILYKAALSRRPSCLHLPFYPIPCCQAMLWLPLASHVLSRSVFAPTQDPVFLGPPKGLERRASRDQQWVAAAGRRWHPVRGERLPATCKWCPLPTGAARPFFPKGTCGLRDRDHDNVSGPSSPPPCYICFPYSLPPSLPPFHMLSPQEFPTTTTMRISPSVGLCQTPTWD